MYSNIFRFVPRISPLQRISLWWRNLSPSGLFLSSFLILIVIGTSGLLWIPGLYSGQRLGLLDSIFTITSAVCVTGLTVVDTATYFTFWGQLWLLLFIQLGGLGLFTLTTTIIGSLGRQLSLRTEMIAGSPIKHADRSVVSLTYAVAKFTIMFEAAGALLLWVQWIPRYGFLQGLWHAVFHSVSAFCNAGFSTFSNSLADFANRPFILLPISLLIISGGIGFLSTEEAIRWWRAGNVHSSIRLSSHTFSALIVSVILLFSGTIFFSIFEWSGTLGYLGTFDKLVNSWFMSVTARTAGFNSVSYAQVGNASAFLTILLMVIGGSPGSTAGGIKTTALAVLFSLAVSRVLGRRYVSLHGRSIPEGTVQRTVSLTLIAFSLLTISLFFLTFSEAHTSNIGENRQAFLPLFFEVASALGTVGLSMDITPTLSMASKILEIFLMFIGRVGPLAFFAAISIRSDQRPRHFRTAHEDLIVG